MSVLSTVSQQIEQLYQSCTTSASQGQYDAVFSSVIQIAQLIVDNRDEMMQEIALLSNINLDMDFVTYEILGVNTPITPFIDSSVAAMYTNPNVAPEQQYMQAATDFANEWRYYYSEFLYQASESLKYLAGTSTDIIS